MFTLFPDPKAPAIAWLVSHGSIVILSSLALAAFVTMLRFSRPSDGGGYDGAMDCSDGHDGGDACLGD
jgi:hypothetical protein